MACGFADVLVGLQYGDEGKARVIDVIADEYDIVARFNGGANAGHTIETDTARIALHQVPSGVMYPDKILYVGSGCVINLPKLLEEIKAIEAIGIKVAGRLHISSQASVVQPHHIILDSITGQSIGTTKNGIGPAYSDRALRMADGRLLNVRLGDFLHSKDKSLDAIEANLEHIVSVYHLDIDIQAEVSRLAECVDAVIPYIERDTLFLDKLVSSGKRVLFEGAQSFMLDVAKGTVPFVTASHTVAGYAYVGGDLSPKYHRKTIGVGKAIMSRVGNGPFVSEFGKEKSEHYCMDASHTQVFEAEYDCKKMLASTDSFEVGIALRILGNEYGATTKRPRRVGSLDLVQLAFAAKLNGVDELYLNKCDLLKDYADTYLKGIPMVTKYVLDGTEITHVPGVNSEYRRVEGGIKVYPCFAGTVEAARTKADLPGELIELIGEVEKVCGCKVAGIGVGAKRQQFVVLKEGRMKAI